MPISAGPRPGYLLGSVLAGASSGILALPLRPALGHRRGGACSTPGLRLSAVAPEIFSFLAGRILGCRRRLGGRPLLGRHWPAVRQPPAAQGVQRDQFSLGHRSPDWPHARRPVRRRRVLARRVLAVRHSGSGGCHGRLGYAAGRRDFGRAPCGGVAATRPDRRRCDPDRTRRPGRRFCAHGRTDRAGGRCVRGRAVAGWPQRRAAAAARIG